MADYHEEAANRASQVHADKRQPLGQRPVKPQGPGVSTPTGVPTSTIPGAREAAQNKGANQ